MSAKMEIELQHWIVPNFVTEKRTPNFKDREEWRGDSPTYAISELTVETLSELCDEFRAGVFQKAGKVDPNDK